MEKVTIEVPVGKKAEWVNGVLTLVDSTDDRPITERVKSYEDACHVLKEPIRSFDGMSKDEIAYMKLKTITRALNEDDSFPEFTDDEYRYFPWFRLYTSSEIKNISKKDRDRLLLWGGNASNGSDCGLACADSSCAFSYSNSSVGARLALKSKELAIYCGNQFKEIWFDFLICK